MYAMMGINAPANASPVSSTTSDPETGYLAEITHLADTAHRRVEEFHQWAEEEKDRRRRHPGSDDDANSESFRKEYDRRARELSKSSGGEFFTEKSWPIAVWRIGRRNWRYGV